MDTSFTIFDDISLNNELISDLQFCGDSSFVWQLEIEAQEFLYGTPISESIENIENSIEPKQTKDQELFENVTSNLIKSVDDTCEATRTDSKKNINGDAPLAQFSVSPSVSGIKEKQKSFECSLCGKHFAQKSSCNRHKREQHLKPDSFHCNKCDLRFSKKFNLQAHQKRAHSKNLNHINGFKCPYCSCVYSKEMTVKKHIKDYHNNGGKNETISPTLLTEDSDPQREAENVLKQLMLLQKDIEEANAKYTKTTKEELDNTSSNTVEQITSIDNSVVKQVTIKDRLYPFGEAKEIKVQQIKRIDGIWYLVCEYCSKEFRKSYSYLRHRRIHSRIRPFICVICKKSFPTQNQLKRHCSCHKFGEISGQFKRCYRCPKCFENILNISQFDNHLSSHLPHCAIVFKCQKCNKSFQSLRLYLRHKHHTNDPELNVLKSLLPSPLCVVDGNEANSVFNSDHGGNYQCSLCSLKVSSSVALKQHEKRHRNLRKFQCFLCNGYYASRSSLEVHRKIHLNQQNFQCQKCNQMFRTNYQLKRHGLKHTNTKNYKCRYCNEMFKTPQYCRSHMMTHLKKLIKTNNPIHEQKENLTTVQTFIENKNNREIVITEMQIFKNTHNSKIACPKKQEKDLAYKCSKCPLQFPYNAWLKKHVAQTHAAERPFKCEICLKTFRKNQVLKTHLLTHENERSKEICVVCGKKYTSKKSLKVHLRLHTDEKPFECEICKKTFRTSGHLIQHRKSNHKDAHEGK